MTNRIDALHTLLDNAFPPDSGETAEVMINILMSNDRDAIRAALALDDADLADLYYRYDCCPTHECDLDCCDEEGRDCSRR